MYRAVHLDPGDRDLHRFLWREQPTGPLVDFRMTRVTFGVSSSPYLAIRALQVAHDFGHQYPVAHPLIFDSFYVDDLLTGADTPEQAQHIYQQTRALLLKGNWLFLCGRPVDWCWHAWADTTHIPTNQSLIAQG